ncbi:MAG: hypothetical protein QOE86_4672 [Solirubrobacteraceae bacterium]|nr:hypothetical protein [Solirubrobacteraceae bacterium]
MRLTRGQPDALVMDLVAVLIAVATFALLLALIKGLDRV